MKKSALLFFFTILILQAPAQVIFQKTFGLGSVVNAESLQRTLDGGYILGGDFYKGNFDTDFLLIKLNALGDTIWTKTYGGTSLEYFKNAWQESDGSYIIVGGTHSFGVGSRDAIVIKTDSSGNVLWSKTFGSSQNYEQFCGGKQLFNGDYILYGSYDNRCLLIKIDQFGNLIWQYNYIWGLNSQGFSFLETDDGGYLLAGTTNLGPSGSSGVGSYLLKTDINGILSWLKIYQSQGNANNLLSVKETVDGGFITAGYTNGFGAGDNDFFLMKTDSLGNQLWTRAYGGPLEDDAFAVNQTPDGGYILYGNTVSFGAGNYDLYIVKTDGLGNLLWSKTYGGPAEEQPVWHLPTVINSSYMIVGETSSFNGGNKEIYLIQTDSLGNSGCFESNPSNLETQDSMIVSNMTATIFSFGLETTPSIITGSGCNITTHCISTGEIESKNNRNNISIFPNPASDQFEVIGKVAIIRAEIYDAKGRAVFNVQPSSNTYQVRIDVTKWNEGVYLLKIETEEFLFNDKILVIK